MLEVNGNENVGRPSDDVAVSVYPPDELPTSICPYDGADVKPVPPYRTPTDVVADTTPAFACSGPLSEPNVRLPLNVFAPVNVLVVYVLGIVVEAAMYELIALFCVVASIVKAPPTLDSPAPKSEINDEPPKLKFVVEAVVNDPYVVDE